ncbi:replication initiation regulator SeqA [Psychromonas sp. KJ10-10]|uniref:replication initiation regulator SeqA n=1 Tax=Psychromonas sp. KJ10-10 TaxID=3391823 RepID=UPI0039B386CB
MKTIDIEDDLYKYILANIEAFGETPSQILRRLLLLPTKIEAFDSDKPDSVSLPNKPVLQPTPKPAPQPSVEPEETLTTSTSSFSFDNGSLPEAFANGVEALFDSEIFQQETVITNKFKMMLTTMYFENTKAFIEASKVAKGRSRDYLGENLETLLASDNKEEVNLLIASKPKEIPYTPFWVVTNANTGRKRIILTQVMASMGYPHHLIERIKEEI